MKQNIPWIVYKNYLQQARQKMHHLRHIPAMFSFLPEFLGCFIHSHRQLLSPLTGSVINEVKDVYRLITMFLHVRTLIIESTNY